VGCYREIDKHNEIVEMLEEYIKTDNANYKAYVWLGNEYVNMNRFEDAIRFFEKAIVLNPDAQEAYSMIAITYQVLGKHQKALEAFEKGLEGNKAYNANINHLYANSLNTLNRYEEAISYYQKSLENNDDNSSAWCGLGQCYYNLKKYKDAVKAYEKALQLKPDNLEAVEDLLNVYEKLNENDKALDLAVKFIMLSPEETLPAISLNAWGYNIINYYDAINSYLKINSDNIDNKTKGFLYCCLGIIAAEQGNSKMANEAYTKSLKIFKQLSKTNKSNPFVFWGLGTSCYGLAQYSDAIKHYKTSIKIDSTFTASYAKLAFLYATCPKARYGNGKEAVRLSNKACELTNFGNDVCLSVLAVAYAKAKEFEKAIEFQEKAIELASDDNERQEYKKRLETYKANRPWRQ
jgi:tetratricopeptide (TPR) repeat protein